MSRLTRGYTIASLGIIFWSLTGVLISFILTRYNMPALLMAFWRSLFVCVALFPVLFISRRSLISINASQSGFYILYGLDLALFNSIWALSLRENGAAVATVLGYSSAGFTAIIAFWLFNEKLGIPKITAVVLSLGGCVMVSNAYNPEIWRLNSLGVTTGLLSGLLFASYTLIGKEATRKNLNPWTSMFFSFAFGTLFILIFNLFPILPGSAGSLKAILPLHLPVDGWLFLIFLSFGPTLLGFGLYNISMQYLPASIANLLATTEPVLTAIEAYIFLGERMTVIEIVGSLVIFSAVVIVQLEKE